MTKRFYEEPSSVRAANIHNLTSVKDKDFNLLIVGSGMIGREHMRVANLLGGLRVHGIFDSNQQSMDIAETEFQTHCKESLVRYESLSEACADPKIDAILICTPNYTHHEVLREAGKSEKPLFIEKPMATTLKDGFEILKLSEVYPAFIQIGMQYRYKAQYVDAFHEIKMLKSLGEIKTISISEYRPPFLDKVDQWNKFNKFSGGTLVEKCCHYFDLINLMADSQAVDVYASGGMAVNFIDFEHKGQKSDIDDHGYAIINYCNGIRANFTLNMFSSEFYEELIVTGERGRLIVSENASPNKNKKTKATIRVEVPGHPYYAETEIGYPELVEKSGHHGATFFEQEALICQLKNETVDSATPRQGLMAMLVASAAQESIKENKVINIADYAKQNKLGELLNFSD